MAVVRDHLLPSGRLQDDEEAARTEAEKTLQEAGKDVPYPSYETLKKEAAEEEPYLLFLISRRRRADAPAIKQPIKAGVHLVVWDFPGRARSGPFALVAPANLAPVG